MSPILSTSLLFEILAAIVDIENAPKNLQVRAQAEVVIERVCATLPSPESLDCAVDVLIAISPEVATQ